MPREALSKIKLGDIPISKAYKFNVTMAPLTNDGEKTKKSNDKYYRASDMNFIKPKANAVPLKPEEMDKYVRVVIKLQKIQIQQQILLLVYLKKTEISLKKNLKEYLVEEGQRLALDQLNL